MASVIRNSNLFCTCCGGEYKVQYPIPTKDLETAIKIFEATHKDCKQIWVEPKADQGKSTTNKAHWWIANGETGSSSKTMWNCFMGTVKFPIDIPWDPDDFSRCYKLLQAVPEFKMSMDRLRSLSDVWNRLVDNWDKLTEMYEQNVREDFKNYKKVGMYDFMQKIIEDKL